MDSFTPPFSQKLILAEGWGKIKHFQAYISAYKWKKADRLISFQLAVCLSRMVWEGLMLISVEVIVKFQPCPLKMMLWMNEAIYLLKETDVQGGWGT